MLSVFKEIVKDINSRFVYKTDMELYGRIELWNELKEIDGKLYGDCEDHSISVANRCIEAGIPPKDLSIHLVATRNVPDHIVLCYKGKWWADCNEKKVVRRIPYKKISFRRLDRDYWEDS